MVRTCLYYKIFSSIQLKTFLSRYKNGEKVQNNHVKYFEYPIARIETVDPEDEGIYQCLARNDYGEVSNTFYLHIRHTDMLDHSPRNAKCFPKDKNVIHVTFSSESESNKIHYFIASDSPRDFRPEFSMNVNINSLDFDTNSKSIVKPFKPFYLYMRNMDQRRSMNQVKMIVSQLSKPIICATQGIEPKFVKSPNGIFFRWDAPPTDSNITSYTIQFLNNKTSEPVVLSNEVVGTYETWPKFVSWSEVDRNLKKIPAKSSNKTEWTEVQVPGNVTGLYIINKEELNVRILGTIKENGELLDQDLRYLSWTNIKASSFSLEPIKLGEFDSRSAEILWTGLESVLCASICSNLKQDFISRDTTLKCEEM